MDALLEFFSFTNPNVRYVTLGMMLLGISSGIAGTFAFLRKRTLVGDAISHAVLPGICLAFLLSGTKQTPILLAGAFATGWLSLLVIDVITHRTTLPVDAAIALTLSVFFGIGIMLLTAIQKTGKAAQAGLDVFLFGNAASLVGHDLLVFCLLSLLILITIGLFYKEFKVVCFDRDFAHVSGIPVRLIETILASVIVLTVTIGIQAVGVVLMAALLIAPAAAASYWTDSLKITLAAAASIGTLGAISGAFISFVAPSMPTGPWVILTLFGLTLLSMAVAPRKGWLPRWLNQRSNQKKILRENVLKLFYKLGEKDGDFEKYRMPEELLSQRNLNPKALQAALRALRRRSLVSRQENQWRLTPDGIKTAQRIIKIHRLWELYLNKHLHIAADHVHNDAEAIEHIITPELEAQLEHMLSYPGQDPHQTPIPYSSDLKHKE
ncbi:MAG: manganese ABC transporter permease [Chitinophagales bacterium]|nr:MAG: manganese ABC transporter permease [Chitinophagales bacterium]